MVRGALGLLLVAAVGCFDDSITGSSTVTGTYTLRTVNGSPVPYTVPASGPGVTEIVSGSIVLYKTTVYARDGLSRTTLNGQVTEEHASETGNWTIEGTRISLRGATGTVTETLITGNDMTIVNPGMTLVFRK
jgi:hypothetical protein